MGYRATVLVLAAAHCVAPVRRFAQCKLFILLLFIDLFIYLLCNRIQSRPFATCTLTQKQIKRSTKKILTLM